jgi:hypothetical protein
MNLEDLYRTRHAFQAAEAAAEQAVHREQGQVDTELDRVRSCERLIDDSRDRATYDTALAASETSKKDHALAVKHLTDAQGEHARAALKAHTAVTMVVTAVDKILTDELAERARQIERHLDEACRLGTALKYFAVAAAIHAPGFIEPSTERVLNRLHASLIDGHEIPNNLEKLGDIPAFRDWIARRERMIAGKAPVQEGEAA